MLSKNGAIGEGILTFYRIILVAFIALVVLGISSVFYSHYINVRDSEAKIMIREIAECLSEEYDLSSDVEILKYCGFEDFETERFFARVSFFDLAGEGVAVFFDGDSGSEWIKEIFDEDYEKVENIKKYRPGYFEIIYPFYDRKNDRDLNMKIEVLVLDDE
ncbi:MAG: hypothetical protein WC548_03905 [Candidatus Pacearchaeota archaeon]